MVTVSRLSGLTNAYTSVESATGSLAISGASRCEDMARPSPYLTWRVPAPRCPPGLRNQRDRNTLPVLSNGVTHFCSGGGYVYSARVSHARRTMLPLCGRLGSGAPGRRRGSPPEARSRRPRTPACAGRLMRGIVERRGAVVAGALIVSAALCLLLTGCGHRSKAAVREEGSLDARDGRLRVGLAHRLEGGRRRHWGLVC